MASEDPRHIVIFVHGYAEHLGRYDHVAELFTARGAVVAGPDHLGHGRSGGESVLIADFDEVVADLHTAIGVVTRATRGCARSRRPLDGRHDRRPLRPAAS